MIDGTTSIAVWILPTIPAGERAEAHADNVDDGCAERSCVAWLIERDRVDDHPASSSTVTSTDDEDLIAVVTTVLAPRHLVLIEVECYAQDVDATDLAELLDGITIEP